MYCNFRPPDNVSVILRFNYDAYAKVEVGHPIHSWLIMFYCWHLGTLWPWLLTL